MMTSNSSHSALNHYFWSKNDSFASWTANVGNLALFSSLEFLYIQHLVDQLAFHGYFG